MRSHSLKSFMFENKSPGSPRRKNVLEIENLFLSVFQMMSKLIYSYRTTSEVPKVCL